MASENTPVQVTAPVPPQAPTTNTPWYSAIPEGHTLTSFQTPEDFEAAWATRIPGEDAKPEDWGSFYNKLGRPETPLEYELAFPADFPPEFAPTSEHLATVATKLHEAGLTKSQAQNALSVWSDLAKQDVQGMLGAQTAENEAMKAKYFGEAYDTRSTEARQFVESVLKDRMPQLYEVFKDAPIESSPQTVLMIDAMRQFHAPQRILPAMPANSVVKPTVNANTEGSASLALFKFKMDNPGKPVPPELEQAAYRNS